MSAVICPGCSAAFPDVDGPVHPYMESSPGCWAVYGEVLAREYSEPQLLDVHRLTVDAYAVQHPGRPSSQSIKSVGVHIIRLYLMLERGLDVAGANEAMLVISKSKDQFVWLPPPPQRGRSTVHHVHRAHTSDEHRRAVWEWARCVWAAWSDHHATIAEWARRSHVAARSW